MAGFLSGIDPMSIQTMRLGDDVVWTRVGYLISCLKGLPAVERDEVMAAFCPGCSDYDPERKCNCMRDD